jgi:isopropylmalate/homocitrate/citramalate synthase
VPLPPFPRRVRLVEVGPRDGLQNEPAAVPTAEKVAFVDRLSAAGHAIVEVTAFVSPHRVPQMADAEAVLASIARRPGTRYTALVPNPRGLERAVAAGVDEVAIFAAASEGFSRRNIGRSIDESLAIYATVCREAGRAGLPVRGYLSTAFGCPFDGPVAPRRVAEVARRLADLGVYEVALSDTIGVAHPATVEPVVEAAADAVGLERLALHLHDTRGTALANVLAGLALGIAAFDASAGGLGGCPFAPGAAGNLATEDLLYLLDGLGIETGVSLQGVVDASRGIEPVVGHPLPSRCYRAIQATGHTSWPAGPAAR